MARKHYWQFLVTDEGNPIENAQISIYTAGTEDPVYVYTDEVGAGFSSTAPQTVTSRKGYFEFWIADENEANGYPLSTKFKIAWAAAGVSDGYIDYIDVFSTSWAPVDETDVDPLKNKALSNLLAKGWEDHRQEELPFATPHGLDVVVETNTDGDRNKVISNYQGFLWDTHAKRQYDGSLAAVVNPNEAPVAHGIAYVDETDSNVEKNKLVSNLLAKGWEDHTNNVVIDAHPQYPLADASGTQFTGKITGLSTISADVATTLITKDYVDDMEQVAIIEPSSNPQGRPLGGEWVGGVFYNYWTDIGGGLFKAEFPHGVQTQYPVVVVWESGINEMVSPEKVFRIDVDTTEITLGLDGYHVVRVFGKK